MVARNSALRESPVDAKLEAQTLASEFIGMHLYTERADNRLEMNL
jgi:hypothetical protein